MFIFTVTADTFLKVRPSELAELAEDEKLLIQVKSVLEVISYAEEEEYYRITLKNSINGKDTWFIRKKYIKICVLQDLSEYTPRSATSDVPPDSVIYQPRPQSSASQAQGSTSFWKKLLPAKINSVITRKAFEFLADGLVSYSGLGVEANSNVPVNESSWDSSDIEVEKEVIKQLKAQLQETPTIQECSSQPADIAKDLVDCSVFSPASVTPDDMFLVQVFVHLPEQVEFAKQYAQQFDPEAKQLGVRSLGVPIKRGSELTFNLSIPKLEVDDPIQRLSWNGKADSIQFGVTVPGDITQKTVIGTVTVSQNTIPLGHLKFKLSIIPSASSTSKHPQLVGEVARYYRKAFVSYSSKDRIEVLKRVQGLAVSGITVFQDILNLEPGDRWEQELYRNIDECDLFLLFWSTAAKESPWVLKEVLYALERQGSDGLRSPEIIPVIIEGPPLVPPPPELQDLHFNDKLLYLMATSK
ncbi:MULTISPECIES: toll/interleukin-1 receptor domain-containing protein [Nostoc]|uniref:Toll/interleukin-1 receptor domain-containing protein n=2 Tax=Nostoc TaxID=1177 RepID=A0ABR8IA59_9NOSO|nr:MULTISPECIES: toll/interleukin-1 receptor domain-containing protein [Nostoc]MBD2562307.1 toll/interleukin-1 receptor domain-containing protein [Nostoc linckia FACHB-391]MBD2647953.1 toll/interleukin-1 receptor domain-containing protein [Nostoc foliaceum FACHB-393]